MRLKLKIYFHDDDDNVFCSKRKRFFDVLQISFFPFSLASFSKRERKRESFLLL